MRPAWKSDFYFDDRGWHLKGKNPQNTFKVVKSSILPFARRRKFNTRQKSSRKADITGLQNGKENSGFI